jgi:hypothetical protein
MIGIIVKTTHIDDPALADKLGAIFDRHYSGIFDSAGEANLAFPKERVVELLKWILVKTRNDFLREITAGSDKTTVFNKYVDEWDFMLSVLRRGIYSK